VLLALLLFSLTASHAELTVKIGITGQAKLMMPNMPINTGAATTRVTAPVAVV
jgi:hypothetical protein